MLGNAGRHSVKPLAAFKLSYANNAEPLEDWLAAYWSSEMLFFSVFFSFFFFILSFIFILSHSFLSAKRRRLKNQTQGVRKHRVKFNVHLWIAGIGSTSAPVRVCPTEQWAPTGVKILWRYQYCFTFRDAMRKQTAFQSHWMCITKLPVAEVWGVFKMFRIICLRQNVISYLLITSLSTHTSCWAGTL